MPIRLMENFRAIFYSPYYATHALGFYAREGVDVELMTSDVPGDAVPKLLDGTVDITWGGPMRVMKAHDQDSKSPLVNFCEVVSHDPFFLIGKRGANPFQLTDLARNFASVSEVPTPWMCLQQDLRDQGMDPDACAHLRPGDDAQLRCAPGRRPRCDAGVRAVVSMAEKDRAGESSMRPARAGRPPTPPSSQRVTPLKHRDEFAAMTRATAQMLAWLYAIRLRSSPRPWRRSFPTCRPTYSWAHSAATGTPAYGRAKPGCPAGLRAARAKPAFGRIHRPHARL